MGSPILVFWLEIVTMVAVIALVTNKANNIKLFFPFHPPAGKIFVFYLIFSLFLLFGILLLLIYGRYVVQFRILEENWKKLYKDDPLEAKDRIHREAYNVYRDYVIHWWCRRFWLTILFISLFFFCDHEFIISFPTVIYLSWFVIIMVASIFVIMSMFIDPPAVLLTLYVLQKYVLVRNANRDDQTFSS